MEHRLREVVRDVQVTANRKGVSAKEYAPPADYTTLYFVMKNRQGKGTGQRGAGALTEDQLRWVARVILAEIGRRKGVNSAEKMVAASA